MEEIKPTPPSRKDIKLFKEHLHQHLIFWLNFDGTQVCQLEPVLGIPEETWNFHLYHDKNDIIVFPKSLTPKDRNTVHTIASKLDIFHMSFGEGKERFLALSISGNFDPLLEQLGTTTDSNNNVNNGKGVNNEFYWFDDRNPKPIHTKPAYFSLTQMELMNKQNLARQCARLGYHQDIQFILHDPTYVHSNCNNNCSNHDNNNSNVSKIKDCNDNNISNSNNGQNSSDDSITLITVMKDLSNYWPIHYDPLTFTTPFPSSSSSLFTNSNNSNNNNVSNSNVALVDDCNSNSSNINDTNSNMRTSNSSNSIKGQAFFIDTVEQLSHLSTILSSLKIFGFDCEMHSFRTYYPITCLLQISTFTTIYLIDTITLWSHIGQYLNPLFSNPGIIKVGHAILGMDIPCLFRDFGIVIISAFDAQEAAAIVDSKQQGLAKVLEKWKAPESLKIIESKYKMKSNDWRTRPLTEDMIIYAALDVHYLLPLYFLQTTTLVEMSTISNRSSNNKNKSTNNSSSISCDDSNNNEPTINELLSFNNNNTTNNTTSNTNSKHKKPSKYTTEEKRQMSQLAREKNINSGTTNNNNNNNKSSDNKKTKNLSVVVNQPKTNSKVIAAVHTSKNNNNNTNTVDDENDEEEEGAEVFNSTDTAATGVVSFNDDDNDNDGNDDDDDIWGDNNDIINTISNHSKNKVDSKTKNSNKKNKIKNLDTDDESDDEDNKIDDSDTNTQHRGDDCLNVDDIIIDHDNNIAIIGNDDDDDLWDGWGVTAETMMAITDTSSAAITVGMDTDTNVGNDKDVSTTTATEDTSNSSNGGSIDSKTKRNSSSHHQAQSNTSGSIDSNVTNELLPVETSKRNEAHEHHNNSNIGDFVINSNTTTNSNTATDTTNIQRNGAANELKDYDSNMDSIVTSAAAAIHVPVASIVNVNDSNNNRNSIGINSGSIATNLNDYHDNNGSAITDNTNNNNNNNNHTNIAINSNNTTVFNSIGNKIGSFFIFTLSLVVTVLVITFVFEFSFTTTGTLTSTEQNSIHIQQQTSSSISSNISSFLSSLQSVLYTMISSFPRSKLNGKKLSLFGKVILILVSISLTIASLVDFIRVACLNLPSIILFGDVEPSDNNNNNDKIKNGNDDGSRNNNTNIINSQSQQKNSLGSIATEITVIDGSSSNNNAALTPAPPSSSATAMKPQHRKNLFTPNLILTQHDLVYDERLLEIRSVFATTAQHCATLWNPVVSSSTTNNSFSSNATDFAFNENDDNINNTNNNDSASTPPPTAAEVIKLLSSAHKSYSRVSGFRERKNRKHSPWQAKTIFVFKQLFAWREKEAIMRDESPAYICPSSLLLDSAERLPVTARELAIMISPLPHSMRSPAVKVKTTAVTTVVDGAAVVEKISDEIKNDTELLKQQPIVAPVDILPAVQEALLLWEQEGKLIADDLLLSADEDNNNNQDNRDVALQSEDETLDLAG